MPFLNLIDSEVCIYGINTALVKYKTGKMKQILHIEADFDKPELLKNMVEELVTRKNTGNSNTMG